MTFGEFLDYEYGYNLRKAENWDMIRNQMWASLAGMGGDKVPKPDKIIPLWIDKLGKDSDSNKEKEYLTDKEVKVWLDTIKYKDGKF